MIATLTQLQRFFSRCRTVMRAPRYGNPGTTGQAVGPDTIGMANTVPVQRIAPVRCIGGPWVSRSSEWLRDSSNAPTSDSNALRSTTPDLPMKFSQTRARARLLGEPRQPACACPAVECRARVVGKHRLADQRAMLVNRLEVRKCEPRVRVTVKGVRCGRWLLGLEFIILNQERHVEALESRSAGIARARKAPATAAIHDAASRGSAIAATIAAD